MSSDLFSRFSLCTQMYETIAWKQQGGCMPTRFLLLIFRVIA